jgi:hypothetical protein
MSRITIQLDGLSVDGAAPGDTEAFARSLERALARRLAVPTERQHRLEDAGIGQIGRQFADQVGPVLAPHLPVSRTRNTAGRRGML